MKALSQRSYGVQSIRTDDAHFQPFHHSLSRNKGENTQEAPNKTTVIYTFPTSNHLPASYITSLKIGQLQHHPPPSPPKRGGKHYSCVQTIMNLWFKSVDQRLQTKMVNMPATLDMFVSTYYMCTWWSLLNAPSTPLLHAAIRTSKQYRWLHEQEGYIVIKIKSNLHSTLSSQEGNLSISLENLSQDVSHMSRSQ